MRSPHLISPLSVLLTIIKFHRQVITALSPRAFVNGRRDRRASIVTRLTPRRNHSRGADANAALFLTMISRHRRLGCRARAYAQRFLGISGADLMTYMPLKHVNTVMPRHSHAHDSFL